MRRPASATWHSPSIYGGQVATDPNGTMALMKQDAVHAFLAADPRVSASKQGVIGWCFGGGWSLRDAIAHEHPITGPGSGSS